MTLNPKPPTQRGHVPRIWGSGSQINQRDGHVLWNLKLQMLGIWTLSVVYISTNTHIYVYICTEKGEREREILYIFIYVYLCIYIGI